MRIFGQIQGFKHFVKNQQYDTSKRYQSQENQDYYNPHDKQFIARKHDGVQEYYNRRDQQIIACKYDGGLEQVTIELIPDIIQKEEEEGFYQWADKYDL